MAVTKAASLASLAEENGFELFDSATPYSVVGFHRGRQVGFQAFFSPDGKMVDATWHADDEWTVVADLRAEPERHKRDDQWLTGTDKRRPAGVDQLHYALVSSRSGLGVKERELRRRIKGDQK